MHEPPELTHVTGFSSNTEYGLLFLSKITDVAVFVVEKEQSEFREVLQVSSAAVSPRSKQGADSSGCCLLCGSQRGDRDSASGKRSESVESSEYI